MAKAGEKGECPECQETFTRIRREGGRLQVFCGVKCRMRASRRNRARYIVCTWCGNEVLRPPSNQRAKNHFCAPACHGKWMSENLRGANHPRYKGPSGQGLLQVIYKRLEADPRWRTWRDGVLARAHGTCERCGQPATDGHHKRHSAEVLREFLAVFLDPDNGEALCLDCHAADHA